MNLRRELFPKFRLDLLPALPDRRRRQVNVLGDHGVARSDEPKGENLSVGPVTQNVQSSFDLDLDSFFPAALSLAQTT